LRQETLSQNAKNLAGKVLRLIQDRLGDAEFGKNLVFPSRQFAASANRRFELQKCSQFLIRMHNEPPFVVAMCVGNPDRSPVGIHP
jgi:hypothetical protein